MNNWYLHEDVFYNLDLFKQITRGADDEILLVNISNNMDWDDEEENICVLKFLNKQERELAFYEITRKLTG